MSKQAVILAGGKGTRLGSLTRDTPKPLLEVGGRPFLSYLVEEVRRFGFNDIVVLSGPFQEKFERWRTVDNPAGVRIRIVPEPHPAGTAGALHFAADMLAPEFLLLNGDSFFDFNLLDLVLRGGQAGHEAAIALREVEDVSRYGAVTLNGANIQEFGEKSSSGPGLINGGIYLLRREVLDEISGQPCSLENDVLPALVKRGVVGGFKYSGNFIDIGTPEDFRRVGGIFGEWLRRPAAFLDRDGTINRDFGYVHRPDDFEWIPGAMAAIKFLNDHGYLVFVVTNQAGIARGYYDPEDVEALHLWINEELRKQGAHIDRFYYCPHHPEAGTEKYTTRCDCRKPAPGMVRAALSEWRIVAERSFMIGDRETDVEAARAGGIRGALFDGSNLLTAIENLSEDPE